MTGSRERKMRTGRCAVLRRLNWTAAIVAVCLFAACAPMETPAQRDERMQNRIKLDAAVALFEERCKSAGEKIYRTAENVEGILLMKLRPEKYSAYDQNAVDPYGYDGTGDQFVETLLAARNESGVVVGRLAGSRSGFRYLDFLDPKDGTRYRYTGYMWKDPKWVADAQPVLRFRREPTHNPAPRYGVTYEDITTPEERAVWIAGSSLKVIDLHVNEVIAERIGYMIDKGQGNSSGGRQPWTHAQRWACPRFPSTAEGHPIVGPRTREFLEKVLIIKQGDTK